jgi:hypothetical protein
VGNTAEGEAAGHGRRATALAKYRKKRQVGRATSAAAGGSDKSNSLLHITSVSLNPKGVELLLQMLPLDVT